MKRGYALLPVLMMTWVSVGFAGWQDDYRAKLDARNFSGAAAILKREADAGNAEAQNNLGLLTLEGLGVAQDEVEGLALLMVAAQNGYGAAQGNADFAKTRMKREHVDRASEVARNHRWKRGR